MHSGIFFYISSVEYTKNVNTLHVVKMRGVAIEYFLKKKRSSERSGVIESDKKNGRSGNRTPNLSHTL